MRPILAFWGLLNLVKAENLCPDGTDLSFVTVTPDGHCLIDPDFAEFKGPCSEVRIIFFQNKIEII